MSAMTPIHNAWTHREDHVQVLTGPQPEGAMSSVSAKFVLVDEPNPCR